MRSLELAHAILGAAIGCGCWSIERLGPRGLTVLLVMMVSWLFGGLTMGITPYGSHRVATVEPIGAPFRADDRRGAFWNADGGQCRVTFYGTQTGDTQPVPTRQYVVRPTSHRIVSVRDLVGEDRFEGCAVDERAPCLAKKIRGNIRSFSIEGDCSAVFIASAETEAT